MMKQVYSSSAVLLTLLTLSANAPKFVLGRVQGKAVGGGVGLASAVDHCFATKFAAVKLSELAVGIGPFVVGPAVERKLELGFAQLTIDATGRMQIGQHNIDCLYSEVFDSAEEMDNAINTLATKLANSSPEAMTELKKVLWKELRIGMTY